MFLAETFYASMNDGGGRAEVWASKGTHFIKYYDSNGKNFHTEDFPDKTLEDVKSIAEGWTSGDHVLYG